MTRQSEGIKIGCMEPMFTKPSWKKWLDTWLTGFLRLRGGKGGHCLVGPGTLEYFGDLNKRGNHPNIQALQMKSNKFLA